MLTVNLDHYLGQVFTIRRQLLAGTLQVEQTVPQPMIPLRTHALAQAVSRASIAPSLAVNHAYLLDRLDQ